MRLRTLLQDEFDRRRARNPRYSLRAFARQLQTHHSTLSRILRTAHRLTPTRIRTIGRHLGLTSEQVDAACRAEQLALVEFLVTQPGFRPDTRWIATRTGLSIDDVNIAIHLLIHSHRLSLKSASRWKLISPS